MDETAQSRLLSARVVVIGLDGSGITAAVHLLQAGIGHLALIDSGEVVAEDVHFQTLFSNDDLGRHRATAIMRRLAPLNPEASLEPIAGSFNAHTAEEIVRGYDLAVDGLGDWQDKLIASDVCMQLGRPLVHAGISGFSFQLFTMVPGKSACLRCVLSQVGAEDLPPAEAQKARFSPLCGMAGSFQALEAIKLIARTGASAADELIRFDGVRRTFHAWPGLTPQKDCPDCGRWSK
jgi:molybdopterin/thiamine biosynthesis adenylyltransferase